MRKSLRYVLLFTVILPFASKAQFSSFKDSVVQLYGVVMTADSLQALQSVSVVVKGRNQGTITSNQGVFSIVVLKGDVVEFTSVGFKPKTVTIPKNLEGNQFSMIQLMVTDTIYLAATIIKPRPSREQFERDFVNAQIPADNLEIARQNNSENTRRVLMATLPKDGREAASNYLSKQAAKNYYNGQLAPQNIFNPFAWAEFIKAWKRGDFKSK
ncbi:MAG: carboxypeptidase-like regulatory domain-containing protein [Chitinophagaceae bacterium]|nr:carboxypeptidase-like regulatory domain-containing protein [Chitinophagaceae bacterium]